MILIVDDQRFFDRAIKAGATGIFPVGEEHDWVLSRLSAFWIALGNRTTAFAIAAITVFFCIL